MEIKSFCPEDYSSTLRRDKLKMSVPRYCIKRALSKILSVEEDQICIKDGNVFSVANKANSTATLYHYKITQKTEGSPDPWFSYSLNRLNWLADKGIKSVYVLFFEDQGSNYKVYYEEFNVIGIEGKKEDGHFKEFKFETISENPVIKKSVSEETADQDDTQKIKKVEKTEWKLSTAGGRTLYRYNPKKNELKRTDQGVKK